MIQLRRDFTGSSVWQSEEDHIVVGQHLRRRLSHHSISHRSQLWMMLAQQCSGIGVCRHSPDLHLGMRE